CSDAPFFCSTAPQAFFRPDRRFRTPSRAGAVKIGRRSVIETHSNVSRPRLDSFEHGGRLDDHGPQKSAWLSSLVPPCFSLAWIDVAARSTVLYAVQDRWPQHDLRVSMPLCPGTHLAVHEGSRGHRGPSRQGQRSAARCGKGRYSTNLRRLLQRSI